MPEGPELRRSADVLEQLVGSVITAARPVGGRYAGASPSGFEGWLTQHVLTPHALVEVNVKGKLMWWRLGSKDDDPGSRWYLLSTYGMTGGWRMAPASDCSHPTFEFILEHAGTQSALTFDDQRHFGTLRFISTAAELTSKLASLGPDMLAEQPDALAFAQRLLRRGRKTLAESLMDQSTVSGVGNYVKAEALWRARLSPHRTVETLTADEFVVLRDSIVDVMVTSYKLGGATIATYRDPSGSTGRATDRFACYGRSHDPEGNAIVAEETSDGRTTWWAPARQL
jgi:formamidopyrimidine-DNA glycosylase